MSINWFGFAAVCEQPDCAVKGKVAISEIPVERGHAKRVAQRVLDTGDCRRKQAQGSGLSVAAPCRHTRYGQTHDPGRCDRLPSFDVAGRRGQSAIPFYHRLAELTPGARTLPRSRAFPALAQIIDDMVQQAITSDTSSAEIVRQAQEQASGLVL